MRLQTKTQIAKDWIRRREVCESELGVFHDLAFRTTNDTAVVYLLQ